MVLAVPFLLAGCAPQHRIEVTDADLVGSWVHEFKDGPTAMLTFRGDGTATVVDIPVEVLVPVSSAPDPSGIDWGNRLTATATWSPVKNPCCAQYADSIIQLADDGHTTVVLQVDNFVSPTGVFFWYGPVDDELMFRFERLE